MTLVLLIVAGSGLARQSPPSTTKLLKALCKGHEQAADAVDVLKDRKNALKKLRSFVKRARCSVDKDAVLSLYDSFGPEGCKAIAGLLKPKKKAWLYAVIRRYRAIHTCPQLKHAFYNALNFASPKQALQILYIANEDKETVAGSHVFPWLDKGPRAVRLAAVGAILAAGNKAGYAQIMKAYNKLIIAKSPDTKLRKAMLAGMLKLNAQNTIPLLINALVNPNDKRYACDLLAKVPNRAARQMTMALKMIHCTTGETCQALPITNCLPKLGTPAIRHVLSLFDLHRPFIRSFVVSFLRGKQSRDAMEFLLGRYPHSTPADRADIIKILGSYSLKNKRVNGLIDSALKDGDKRVRLNALDVVTENGGVNFCPQVQDLAENDREDMVKAAAVDTIYRLGCRGAIPLLKRMVTYERPKVSIRGLHALALMLETGNLEFLYKLLKSGNENVAKAVYNTLFLLINHDPTKHHVKELPAVKTWQFKGHKLKLPGATAYVKGDEKVLIIVIGGGLDGRPDWVLPGLKELTRRYTLAMVDADAPTCPTEAIVTLLEKVKHDRAYVMGQGIWGLDAARVQLALPYQLQGSILVNTPYPMADAIKTVSNGVINALHKPVQHAIQQLMKESAIIRAKPLNLYYTKLVSPALVPENKPAWSVWGMPSNILRYNHAEVLLTKAMNRNSLSQSKALLVFSGRFIPEKQQTAFRKLKGLHISKLKDCGYFVSPFCMDDLVDKIRDFTHK